MTSASTLFVVLYTNDCKELGEWVDNIIRTRLSNYSTCKTSIVDTEEMFIPTARQIIDDVRGEEGKEGVHVVLAVMFYDGQTEAGKAIFGQFRSWTSTDKTVTVQALNAKKGAHTLMSNEEVVFSSLAKKLPPELSAQALKEGKTLQDGDSASAASVSSSIVHREESVEELTAEGLGSRVSAGQGECFWLVSADSISFPGMVESLKTVAKGIHCGVFPVLDDPKEIIDKHQKEPKRLAQEFIIRHQKEKKHIEMRLVMCGNVDSGKSTLTSVLTRGVRDDGRGLARAYVFRHKHEADTGRTSSISENYLGFDSIGNTVNYPKVGGGTSVRHNAMSPQEMSDKSSKIVTLYDLAGHEKYLKTTVLGMTRSMPDYACVVISANNGIQRMTKEHLGLCLALKLPFFVVVTRIDSTPENIRQETMTNILKLLKMPTVKKLPFPIRKLDDVVVAAKNLRSDRITPIFEVSNVTGDGIHEVVHLINLLPVRKHWNELLTLPKEMIIDNTFFVAGVGTVVGGIITQGTFHVNDPVLLGPDGLGVFRQTTVKSIHIKGVEVSEVEAGSDAAICLKKEKRSAIRKGNVLVDPASHPKAYWQFEGEIVILYHSTTIASNYEPVIHSNTVRQSARITLTGEDILRTGDSASVRFHFLYRPEYIKVGQRLIFREGRTKGIGTVTRLLDGTDAAFINSSRNKVKEMIRDVHGKKK